MGPWHHKKLSKFFWKKKKTMSEYKMILPRPDPTHLHPLLQDSTYETWVNSATNHRNICQLKKEKITKKKRKSKKETKLDGCWRRPLMRWSPHIKKRALYSIYTPQVIVLLPCTRNLFPSYPLLFLANPFVVFTTICSLVWLLQVNLK